jgi:hypothetical protein
VLRLPGNTCRFVEIMSPIFYKYLRGAVFGLMFLLAGSSSCICDSYDADPNDNIPPVRVQFNYVVPGASNVHTVKDHASVRPAALALYRAGMHTGSAAFSASDSTLAFSPASPQLLLPLRR